MRRDATIYGLFDKAERCHYVGCTMRPSARVRSHRNRRPDLTFKVIRMAPHRWRFRVEQEEILKAKTAGHPLLNDNKAHNRTVVHWVRLTRAQSGWLEDAATDSRRTTADVIRCLIDKAAAKGAMISRKRLLERKFQAQSEALTRPVARHPRPQLEAAAA